VGRDETNPAGSERRPPSLSFLKPSSLEEKKARKMKSPFNLKKKHPCQATSKEQHKEKQTTDTLT
jgi:hypothetical protein